jgi:hypothetical protein
MLGFYAGCWETLALVRTMAFSATSASSWAASERDSDTIIIIIIIIIVKHVKYNFYIPYGILAFILSPANPGATQDHVARQGRSRG